MSRCKKQFLYEVEAPGLLYLTLDGHDPVYVGFQHKVKLEVCLSLTDSSTQDLGAPAGWGVTRTSLEPIARNSGFKEEEDFLKDASIEQKLQMQTITKMEKADESVATSSTVTASPMDEEPESVTSPMEVNDGFIEEQGSPLLSCSATDVIDVDNENIPERKTDSNKKTKTSQPRPVPTGKQNGNGKDQKTLKVKKEILYLAKNNRNRTSMVLTKRQLDSLVSRPHVEAKTGEKKLIQGTENESSVLTKDDNLAEKKSPFDSTSNTPQDTTDPVTCQYCATSFPSKREYHRHRKVTSEFYHMCLKCNTAFPFRAYLSIHLKYHEEKSLRDHYMCEECGLRCKNLNELKKHTIVHTGEHCYKCCRCSKTFTTQTNLTKHMIKHRPPGAILCSCCKQYFPTRGALAEHKRSLAEIKCNLCGQVFPNVPSRTIHFKSEHKDTIITCQICSGVYSTKEDFEIHMLKHKRRKKKQCLTCGLYVSNLKTHLRAHKSVDELSDSELFMCDKCPAKFKNRDGLRRHLQTHSEERFNCHLCPQTFSAESCLFRHVRNVHSSLMPYQCEVCGKRCKQKSNLRVHMRIHSSTKMFPCTFCDQAFNYKASLVGHIKSKHSLKKVVGGSDAALGSTMETQMKSSDRSSEPLESSFGPHESDENNVTSTWDIEPPNLPAMNYFIETSHVPTSSDTYGGNPGPQ